MTQFSLAQIVRPDMTALTSQYQGKSSEIPICWPGTLEPGAGGVGSGYTALMAGTPVPFGSRLVIWLPAFIRWTSSQKMAVEVVPYAWRFVWRLRNAEMYSKDVQNGRQVTGYRFPNSEKTSGGLFTIPAAISAGILVGAITTPPFDSSNIGQLGQQLELVENWVRPNATVLGEVTALGSPDLRPYAAGSRAFLEQALGSASYPQANLTTLVTWNPIVVDALGDELVILQTSTTTGGTWSFTDPYSDKLLYQALYENSNVGIYVISGTGVAGTLQQQESIVAVSQPH